MLCTPQDCGDVQTFCGMLKTFARRHTRQNVSFSRFAKRLDVGAMMATCKRSGDVPTCKRSDVPTSAPELGKCRRENVLFRHFVGTSSVGTSTLTCPDRNRGASTSERLTCKRFAPNRSTCKRFVNSAKRLHVRKRPKRSHVEAENVLEGCLRENVLTVERFAPEWQ